jgi:hypothetical protein
MNGSAFYTGAIAKPRRDPYLPGDDAVNEPDLLSGVPSAQPGSPARSRTGGATAVSPGAGANPSGAYAPDVPSAERPAGAFAPSRSRSSPDAAGSSNPVFLPNPPSLGQTTAQPNLIRDVYAPELQDVSQKLQSAYEAPRPGMFRQVAGALLSRKNPAIGGLVSGETQRQRTIEPLQQEYNLIGGQIQATRAADSQDIENRLKGAQITQAIDRGKLANAQAQKQETPTDKLLHQGYDADGNATALMQRPDNSTYIQKIPGMMNPTTQKDETPLPPQDMNIGGQNHKVLFDKQGNVIKDLGPSKLPNEKDNEGIWQLDEDAQGNPTLFNSKTGQTKAAPPGLAKTGTKAKADAATEKLIGPARDAQQYANDYLANGRFTGAGDEALQEKFFELAKPTTGFRMTQPQIDMLQNSRSWMQGASAHIRHATTGTWFNDDQRQQIVGTMKDLADAKMKGQTGAGGGAAASPATGAGEIQVIRDANGRITGIK